MKESKLDKEITDDDDFIMIERNGEILSGGFHVNSILLKHNRSPMYTLNKNLHGGQNVSDLFKDLAIPSGLYFQPKFGGGGNKEKESADKTIHEENELHDDIYDKLVKIASVSNIVQKKKKTRRAGKITHKNTQKHLKIYIK